jgi:hypothetical protein
MKNFTVSSGVLAVLFFFTANLNAQSSGAQSSATPNANTTQKTAGEAFKNIQVLKQVPSDQLIPAMQFITASLGVECGFCHVEGAFDKDDKKPKQTARKMMEMMISINADNFDGHREVTCFTCHRGSSRPVAIPIIAVAEPNAAAESARNSGSASPAATAQAAHLPTVDAILEKYIQALGGETAIAKLSTLVETGTTTLGAHQFPIEIFDRNPDQRSSVIHLSDGNLVTTYDGKEGWTSTPGRPLRPMNSADKALAKLDADLHLAIDLKQTFDELKVDRQENVLDRRAYVVLGSMKGIPPVQFYFDETSGLLLRDMRYIESPLGLNPVQTDYFDYREVGGVKLPFRWIVSRPTSHFEVQLNKVQQNVPIDDSKFAKPVPSPE